MKEVALGAYHTCALLDSGGVACWGDNTSGQLGDGGEQASTAPVRVSGVTHAVEIRAGYDVTCARLATGDITCWGANSHGQAAPKRHARAASPEATGAYDTVNEPLELEPANVRRMPSVLALGGKASSFSMGMLHGCAVLEQGQVVCWGDDSRGQCGRGLTGSAFALGEVVGLPPVVEVAAGGDSSCARTASGDVWCWGGDNEHAQLGTAAPGPALRQVPGVAGASSLEVTAGRACGRDAAQRWLCWGDSGGCGDTSSRNPPAEASDLGRAQHVVRAHGGCFWCVLRPKQEVECIDAESGKSSAKLTQALTVEAGNEHACAVRLDGSVWCWGRNIRGELGRSTAAAGDEQPGPVDWGKR